jgi:hypothetical protein
VSVAGFLALGLWQLANTLASHRSRGSSPWSIRIKGIAKTVLYLALSWASFSTATGHPGSSTAQSADSTATLLQQDGGRLVVAGIGLAVIAAGAYHVFKGWTKKFLRDLNRHPGALATRAGVIGYIAKGVALGVVGVLFFLGAKQNSALKATGLDGALRTLREQPKGPWLLTAVALGIAAYGFYSFARAKHARVWTGRWETGTGAGCLRVRCGTGSDAPLRAAVESLHGLSQAGEYRRRGIAPPANR